MRQPAVLMHKKAKKLSSSSIQKIYDSVIVEDDCGLWLKSGLVWINVSLTGFCLSGKTGDSLLRL